jgi:hypothetical protein
MAYVTPRYQQISLKKVRFEEFVKLPEEERNLMSEIWLQQALSDERYRYSQRLANSQYKAGIWEHAIIKRVPSEDFPGYPHSAKTESWIIFRPDNESARDFHSFQYWSKYWEAGETILCSGTMMSWNTLKETDEILITIMDSARHMTEWEVRSETKKRVTKFQKRFGL